MIFQQRDWAKRIGHFLAKKLQAEGCELAALTFKKTTHKFITGQDEVKYQFIENVDAIWEDPKKTLAGEEISLDQICDHLGLDSIWPLIYCDRWLAYSYGRKFYYSFRKNVPDEFMTTYIKAHYKVVRDLLEKFKPDLIIMAGYVYEGHILLGRLGEINNIPNIAIADAKVPGYNIFVHDYLVKKGSLTRRVKELNSGIAQSENFNKASNFIEEFRKEFKHPVYITESPKISWLKKIKSELAPYKHVYNWYTKKKLRVNNIESVGPTIDYRPPRIILRDFYCKKKYKRFADKYSYFPFDKVGKFVFFPLQFTPEASADLICPLFNNQIETARQIAMSLPSDYTLVVKEHPAMVGLRTPSYLEKVALTPNVKLVDYRIPTERILKKTDLVISAYSTTIFEAALYKKPAILLSDSGIFSLMPNVFKHSDMSSLSAKIKEVLDARLNIEEYEKKLTNYIAAVFDVGFNFNYGKAWEKGGEDLEIFWNLYKTEIKRVLNEEQEKKDTI